MFKHLKRNGARNRTTLTLEGNIEIYKIPKMNLIKFLPFLLALMFAYEKAMANDLNFNNIQVIDEERLLNGLNNDLGKEHPLYKKILDEFGTQYERIGQRQAQNALQGKDIFVGGGLNKIGIRYAKSFIDFNVNIERQLSPDLFDDERWIVRDVFSFEISANKLLSKLSDEGVIEVGESQYALFTGLSFKRQYTWVHFADSYTEGLTKNFQKLFLPFLAFQGDKYKSLPNQEILKKEDFLTFSAGAIGSMPISGPLWLSAGALGRYTRLASVQFQSVDPNERVREDEVLRMQVEKAIGAEVGIRASLQIDFLKLLRFTLLSFDFSYEYEHRYKAHLSFTESELHQIEENDILKKELKRGMRFGEIDTDLFRPMLLALEDSKKAIMKSKYVLLLLGGMKDQATTHIQITKDDELHTFFKHFYEKTNFIQNFWSRIFGGVMRSLLGLESVTRKSLLDLRSLEIEYKSKENLIESKNKISIDNDNFSMVIGRKYNTGKLTKLTKKHAVNILETYGGVDPLVWHLLRSNQLQGPLTLSGKYIIKKEGLEHFNKLSLKEVYNTIRDTCSNRFFCRISLEKSFDRYWKEINHKSYSNQLYKTCRPKFKLFRSAKKRRYLWESCIQKRTKLTMNLKFKNVPLWRFKDFAQKITEKSKTKVDLYNYFGLSNVFLHGSFEALDLEGRDFISYFREGDFNGLGLIDSYLLDNGLNSTSSK